VAKYPKIIVYGRCSSDEQKQGNSFERQRELATSYMTKNGIPLEGVEWLNDEGKSAFSGDHLESGELGKLLKRVKNGGMKPGCLIIFEAVDRASRQGALLFLTLINEFLQADFYVSVLNMHEGEPFNKNNQSPFFGTELAILADIARVESKRKSDFSLKNWNNRRKAAMETGAVLTRECPRWLTVVDGKYVLNREHGKSIEKVFKLRYEEKWGISRIVRLANDEQWPVPATGDKWHLSLLSRLFKNRALIGELQLFRGSKKKREEIIGGLVLNYYPVAVDPDLFHKVQEGERKAKAKSESEGKPRKFPNRMDDNNYNYLQGLAKCECAEGLGGAWRRLNKNSGKQLGYAQYSCANRQLGATKCANMPSKLFDACFIGIACEKIPELVVVIDDKRAERTLSLESQIDYKTEQIEKLQELLMMPGKMPREIGINMIKREAERTELSDELTALRATNIENPFDFEDALNAYLPSFLDYHADPKTEAAQQAHKARRVFRAKLIKTVESVTVALSRKSMTVRLKNGAEFVQEIGERELGTENDFTEMELEEAAIEQAAAMVKLVKKSEGFR